MPSYTSFEAFASAILEPHLKVEHKQELPLSFGTEPIRAWRVWRLGGSSAVPLIVSASSGVGWVWRPREWPEAVCIYHHPDWPSFGKSQYRSMHSTEEPHPVPARHGCKCGYWGMKDKLFPQTTLATEVVRTSTLIGEVALWGRVVETELGYRAQYAYPLNIQFRKPHVLAIAGNRYVDQPEVARLLSEAYGIPVYTFEEAQQFPSHVTDIADVA